MPEPPTPFDLARAAFLAACRLDVETPKPGNVSEQSAGHGMSAAQFIVSAQAAANPLLMRGASVGKRILGAVTRTREAVGCNTNLGIVLLVAPLAAALEEVVEVAEAQSAGARSANTWREATGRVLARLDIDDTRHAYRAIALANPGGLGEAPEQSVHAEPTIGLRAAMALAAQRDTIARQYALDFEDVFKTGLAAVREMPADAPRLAALNVFLTFLGGRPDSHIVRKQGLALAQSVTLAARARHAQWHDAHARGTLAAATAKLDQWDAELKARGINPGTSADLTVATLFVAGRLEPGRWVCLPGTCPRTGTEHVS